MPPFLLTGLIAIGGILAFRVLRKEWQRVNNELNATRHDKEPLPLYQDPETGVWSPIRKTKRS